MRQRSFAHNLGYLCSFYPSVAEVCRQLNMNRQQFNKYLNGQVQPSRHNMHRICDFFGVTESEMLLDHGHFAEIVSLRRAPLVSDSLAGPLHHVELLYAASKSLDRYVGYYFRYFYSFGRAGKIVKSLASLYEKNGRYYWKNIEIHRPNAPGSGPTTTKYTGVVFFLGERIFIIEYESMLKNAITQVTLYPSYHTRMTRLRGIQTGAPTARGRKPGASLVLMEYLGRRIHVRDALRSSGMFAEDDPAILLFTSGTTGRPKAAAPPLSPDR
jgi:transcriptional regulator with XRE-family HTH domain